MDACKGCKYNLYKLLRRGIITNKDFEEALNSLPSFKFYQYFCSLRNKPVPIVLRNASNIIPSMLKVSYEIQPTY